MKREDFKKIYDQGLDATYDLFLQQNKKIEELLKIIESLTERLEKLEKRLSKDSTNSNLPPSSDGFKKKPKSNREKSDRKPGGQKGHKGTNLKMVEKPDEIIKIEIENCVFCAHHFSEDEKTVKKRQEIEIPPLKSHVIEYQSEEGNCSCCGKLTPAQFPDHITTSVQFGKRFKSILIYFNQYQLIPYQRTVEILNDIFKFPFSKGTLFNAISACYKNLKKPEEAVKEALIKSKAVHYDESGGYCNKTRGWFHVSSTALLTFIGFHAKRGKEAINEFGILPNFHNFAMHDFYSSYLKYACNHLLCNAHLLRELKYQTEELKQKWAKKLKDLIIQAKKLVDERKKAGNESSLLKYEIEEIETEFKKIVDHGLKKNIRNKGKPGKRGKAAQTDTRNLLERLRDWQKSYLGFIQDFEIPFDNNQGERDFRMVKVQQKISGCFRSEAGAKYFCRIRGYISTVKKNGINVLEALYNALDGNPFIPEIAE